MSRLKQEKIYRGRDNGHFPQRAIPTLFGRDVLALEGRPRASAVDTALAYWRSQGFPYPEISARDIAFEMHSLARATGVWSRGRLQSLSTVGLRLANAFHPQMWGIRGHARSPLECFKDDARLRSALEK